MSRRKRPPPAGGCRFSDPRSASPPPRPRSHPRRSPTPPTGASRHHPTSPDQGWIARIRLSCEPSIAAAPLLSVQSMRLSNHNAATPARGVSVIRPAASTRTEYTSTDHARASFSSASARCSLAEAGRRAAEACGSRPSARRRGDDGLDRHRLLRVDLGRGGFERRPPGAASIVIVVRASTLTVRAPRPTFRIPTAASG